MTILTLPRDALIYMDNEKIEVEIPDYKIKKLNMENINNAKGILKSKNIDPLEYQNKVRAEWE